MSRPDARVFTEAKRSQVMSCIRRRGNKKTELALAKLFRMAGITGWRRHATQPKGNAVFWRKKLAANHTRDRLVTRTLRRAGWLVLRIWEHELTRKNQARCRARIHRALLRARHLPLE